MTALFQWAALVLGSVLAAMFIILANNVLTMRHERRMKAIEEGYYDDL